MPCADDCRLLAGDCRETLRALPDAHADAVVTDPPAGIGFMGKTWDKPGVLGVSGGRAMPATMANRNPMCRVCRKHQRGKPPRAVCECVAPDFDTADGRRSERDQFVTFVSSAMSESLRVLKPGGYALVWALPRTSHWTGTALEDAGFEIRDRITHLFGTGFPKGQACLKPAAEDWWLCRKPAKQMTPLNIDECRIPTGDGDKVLTFDRERGERNREQYRTGTCANPALSSLGRYPANVTHDGSAEVLEAFAAFGERKGDSAGRKPRVHVASPGGDGHTMNRGWTGGETPGHADTGTAARFFYCAKASKRDRGAGNTHPTVKNTALMRWLVKLVSKEGDLILDPFMGSGSTGVACVQTGRRFVGCELEPAYLAIAEKRIAAARAAGPLFDQPPPTTDHP